MGENSFKLKHMWWWVLLLAVATAYYVREEPIKKKIITNGYASILDDFIILTDHFVFQELECTTSTEHNKQI